MKRSAMRQGVGLVLALAAVATLVFANGSATADPSISSKRQQARAILAQVRDLDSRLSHAIESYNLANVQLDRITSLNPPESAAGATAAGTPA